MNDEKFRNHLTDIRFQKGNKEIVFEYDDGEKVIGNISNQKVKIAYKDYFIISSIEQLEEYINNISANKDNSMSKAIISCCVFTDQNIIDEILKKYLDKGIRFVHCFFIFSGVINFNINNEKCSIYFGNCYFKGQLELSGEFERIKFSLCDFLSVLSFKIDKFTYLESDSCIFNMGVVFNGKLQSLRNNSLISFRSSLFKDFIVSHAKEFESDIHLYRSEFMKDVYFDRANFIGNLCFEEITFYGEVTFSYSQIMREINFRAVNFLSCLHLSKTEFLSVVDFSDSNFFEEGSLWIPGS